MTRTDYGDLLPGRDAAKEPKAMNVRLPTWMWDELDEIVDVSGKEFSRNALVEHFIRDRIREWRRRNNLPPHPYDTGRFAGG